MLDLLADVDVICGRVGRMGGIEWRESMGKITNADLEWGKWKILDSQQIFSMDSRSFSIFGAFWIFLEGAKKNVIYIYIFLGDMAGYFRCISIL